MKKDIARLKEKKEQEPPAVSVAGELKKELKKSPARIFPSERKGRVEKVKKKKKLFKGLFSRIFKPKSALPDKKAEKIRQAKPLYDYKAVNKDEKKISSLASISKPLTAEPDFVPKSSLDLPAAPKPKLPIPKVSLKPPRQKITKEERKKILEELAEPKKIKEVEEVEKTETPPTSPKPQITPPSLSLSEKEELNRKEAEINKELKEILNEKKPFEAKKIALLKEINSIQKGFNFVDKKEKRIEKEVEALEKKESRAKTIRARKIIEQKRWKIEEKRRAIEKQRWPWDEKLNKIEDKINEIDIEFEELNLRERALIKKQKEISKKRNKIRLEAEKIDLEQRIEGLSRQKDDWEEKKDKLDEELSSFEKKLESVLFEENEIEKEKESIEEREKRAKNLKERRELENKRWQVEEKRRKVESKKWSLEEEKNRIKNQRKEAERKIRDILEKQSNLNIHIKNINQELGLEIFEPAVKGEKSAEREKIEKENKKEMIEKKQVLKKEKAQTFSTSPKLPAFSASLTAPIASLEDNKIEQAKKRVEALRKKLFKKSEEKKKILPPKLSEIQKPPEPVEKPSKPSPPPQKLPIAPEPQIPPKPLTSTPKPLITSESPKALTPEKLPKRPGKGEKLWVRILIFSLVLIALAVVASFWYWYLIIRKQTPDSLPGQTIPPPVAQQLPTSPPSQEPPSVSVSSLFPVDDTIVLEISYAQEIRILLNQAIQEWQDINKFKQVVIKNKDDDKILSLIEIFNGLGVNLSEEISQEIGDNFTLFIYSQINGNRIGFIAEIVDKEKLSELLSSQEPNIKSDFDPLLELVGVSGPALVSHFRDSSSVRGYQGINFRYQTLSQEDLGICYLVFDTYFIFTSSWESITKLIEKLGI